MPKPECVTEEIGGLTSEALSEENRRLRRQNFAVSKCTYLNTLLFPLQVIKRVKDKFFPSSHSDVQPLHPLVNQLLLQALRLEARLIKFINLPFGLSLVCVGKKTGL